MPSALSSLYICYLSLEDPLARTQVVAYLEGLAARGHTIHLLTFEPKLSPRRRRDVRADLARRGIRWHALRYHKRPSLPATVYDALVGAVLSMWLVLRHRLDAVHARSHVPAASALMVCALTRRRLIFDLRGLMADEYADAGRWVRGGLPYRITEAIQRAALRRADGIVVLTERVRRHLFGAQPPPRTHVIPCCADLERPATAEDRLAVRDRLALGDRPVLIYVGKLTGVYMDREMVEFLEVARRRQPELVFLVLTQAPPEPIVAELRRAGIDEDGVRIARAEPGEVGAYLAAANYAICFCSPALSRIASSPTKIGEYLGAGLPVVANAGIGDVDTLLAAQDVGVVIDAFESSEYERAAARMEALAADPECRYRCREVARSTHSLREVGIPRYDALYREVAAMARPDR